MIRRFPTLAAVAAATLALAGCETAPEADPPSPMSFFVTSTGGGNGADFGGLAGADKHCQTLAELAGAGQRTWRAYLSTNTANGGTLVHARDRIGKGPWKNASGDVIANSVDELHGNNKLTKQTALTERGEVVSGRGDTPNQHDILTGSTPDGRAADATCGNWTQSGEGAAIVGHHDRIGLGEPPAAISWNASHPSRGCSQKALAATGGAGLLYCFAIN
jgi:hypothetical protein